jgi:signal transduction histidine kinase
VRGLLDAGVRSFSLDKRYVRKDGTAVYTRAHLALDLDDDLGVALIEDATARRELEERLREAQALEAVGKLAGGIAHDFNNLMTAVSGYADLLLHEVADDRQRRRVEAIQDAAARAADLTRALLAFSRRQVLQVQELDLGALVERAREVVGSALRPQVRLETECPAEPVLVHADPAQLEKVLLNLTTNACQAMPQGGLLRIAARPAGEWAELTVTDTGAGMTDEVRLRAFEPFFSTRGLGEASGLGLATVHGIVGQSGGSVDVESRLGEGTRVTIRLPRVAQRRVAVEDESALALTD